jgi:branched-chain amino acid transport system permease protein
MTNSLRIVVGALAVLIALAIPLTLSTFYINLATKILIFALFAMSLDVLLGYVGLPSLGHSAFFGVAAYGAGILAVRSGLDPWLSLCCAVLIGTALGALLGFLSLRLRGSYFLMITLAFAQVLWAIALGWREMTGGDDGLANVPPLVSSWPGLIDHTQLLYFVVASIVGLSTFIMFLIVRSPFGYSLIGIRDNETRMLALGYNVWLYKYFAFILSAAFASLAGALYTFYNLFVGLDSLSVVRSAEVLLMVIVGGAGTLFGPALGAAVLILLEYVIASYTKHWLLCLGIVYVLATLYAPSGLVGLLQQLRKKSTP